LQPSDVATCWQKRVETGLEKAQWVLGALHGTNRF
jgi:hypothetical protein